MKKIFTLFAAMLLTVTALQAEVLLNEEVSFDDGWGIYRVLDLTKAPSLANVAKGDLLAITVTEADATSQLAIQGSNWQNLDFNSGLSFTTTGKQTVVFLTDSAVAKVKDSGIIVKGYNCTISKVELLYKKSLWEGELDATTNWAQTDPALDNTIFEDLKEGDLLGVTVSKINENNDGWHLYAFRANYRTNFISHDMSDTGVGIDSIIPVAWDTGFCSAGDSMPMDSTFPSGDATKKQIGEIVSPVAPPPPKLASAFLEAGGFLEL